MSERSREAASGSGANSKNGAASAWAGYTD